MRKIILFICLACMLLTMAVGAQAVTGAKSVSSFATVSSDGSCQITLTATIHLDQPVEGLLFPLPGDAENITVNGSRAKSRLENGLHQVDVSAIIGKMAGDFTLTFSYTLPDLVTTNSAGRMQLQLPLLAGFAYPVQALEFSVTLPGQVTAKPAFSSGYHQANIEKDIYCTYNANTIRGFAQVELKDHETLGMTLLVSEDMFPQTWTVAPDYQTVSWLSFACLLLALIYWLLFLRNWPSWPFIQTAAPDGYSAGELGSVLHLRGGDLNMMVFSWAELGYLLIRMEPGGNVLLHRQMQMGNERSAFEQRCFKTLFGGRNAVNATSRRYGEVYRTVEKMKPNLSDLVHPKSGNLVVFRILAALAGMFSGVSVAMRLSEGSAIRWLLVAAFGVCALISAWCMQQWARYLFAARRERLWFALFVAGVWIGLSIFAGNLAVGIGMTLGQLAAGGLLAIGGRRTPAGRRAMGQALGLRRYMATLDPEKLRQICKHNPNYFHQMMPYAMALGVDKTFARRFGKQNVGQCPYITVGAESTMRAEQWWGLMRRVLAGMNTKPEQTKMEKFLSFLKNIRA